MHVLVTYTMLKDSDQIVFISFQRLGKAISLSVERFVTVGETIGEEAGSLVRGPEGERGRGGHTHSQLQDGQARKDMLEACRESRHTGNMVEKLAESLAAQVLSQFYVWLLQSGNLLFQFFLVGEAKLLKDSNLGTRKITKIKPFNLELKYIYTFSK